MKTTIYLRIGAQNIELTEAMLFYPDYLKNWIHNLNASAKEKLIYQLLEVIRSG